MTAKVVLAKEFVDHIVLADEMFDRRAVPCEGVGRVGKRCFTITVSGRVRARAVLAEEFC